MKYHAYLSPRLLTTVEDPLRNYPAGWELLRWYRCLRKYPYESEVIAALVAEVRGEEYSHYPCPINPAHWHIGRGGPPKNKAQYSQAKRVFRKAVRDEIWREHVVREEERARRERYDAALAD